MSAQILLVEDDEDIRTDLAALLKDFGYRVATACHGAEALEYLRSAERPQLMLLDLMMPVMDGWQLRIELLKDRKLADLPVVVLSGAGNVPNEAAALGAVGFVSKPFNMKHLLELVEGCCGRASRNR